MKWDSWEKESPPTFSCDFTKELISSKNNFQQHYWNLHTINDLNSSKSEWTPGVKVESHRIIHLDTRIFILQSNHYIHMCTVQC